LITAAKFARPDSQALQGRDVRKLATPFGQNFPNHLYEAVIVGPGANGDLFKSISVLPTFDISKVDIHKGSQADLMNTPLKFTPQRVVIP
jgi:hypothetical protein